MRVNVTMSKIYWIRLGIEEGTELDREFSTIKKSTGLESNTEVLRYLIHSHYMEMDDGRKRIILRRNKDDYKNDS